MGGESPPEDYLQHVPICVQIKNIHVNHYTKEAITAIGDLVGHVDTVAFDPEKSQRQDFVRVKIIFDVSKPLKKFKVLNLRGGIQHTVYYYYEKVQKICHLCQRLTHAKDRCPFLNRAQPTEDIQSSFSSSSSRPRENMFITKADPLFGVIKDSQVGVHPATGRPRIAPEVLQEMRNYLLSSTREDRKVKEQRIISSVEAVEKDPISQKTVLQLIPPPIFTKEINKDKGIVFDYESENNRPQEVRGPKLMSAAISAHQVMPSRPSEQNSTSPMSSLNPDNILSSTVPQFNLSLTDIIGASNVQGKARRRPGKYKCNLQGKAKARTSKATYPTATEAQSLKRKAEDDLVDASKPLKLQASTMVPNEGPSNA